MIRIDIKWNFVSPSMQRVSGIISVHNISPPGGGGNDKTLLFKCEGYVDGYSCGFKSIESIGDEEGIPNILFRPLEEKIKLMMQSYYSGMLLKNECCHWVDETLNDSFELNEWITKYYEERKESYADLSTAIKKFLTKNKQ